MGRAWNAWFGEIASSPEITYPITTQCRLCGRFGIKLVQVCPASGSFFTRGGDYYRFSYHLNEQGELCENSGHSPELGGPTRPQN